MRAGHAASIVLTWILFLTRVTAAQGGSVTIKGCVLDRVGKAVAGAEVATMWSAGEGVKDRSKRGQAGFHTVKSDGEGRFTLNVEIGDRDVPLMAIDADRTSGGTAVVPAADAGREIEIRLAPLVRVHGKIGSNELGKSPPWTNVYIDVLPGKGRILQCPSDTAEFSMLLPPGDYELYAYGGDVTGARRLIRLDASRPDIDLGTLDLPATFIGKHKGKELPPWSMIAARGARKDVTLADYRGKWVLVDFWGHWCAPCVRQLNEMIDFYDEHAAARDKFEIIAFHDATATDMADMDTKTERTKKNVWRGRDLPFPVLLDSPKGEHGATVEAFGITSFPTTLLIDPDGKLVGEATLQDLERVLPPLPMAYRISRALDRDLVLGMDGGKLAGNIEFLAAMGRIPIKMDHQALKSAGVAPEAASLLTIRGRLTLRSWLELLLDPFGLEAVPGDEGLVVRPAKGGGDFREPSASQRQCAARIEVVLGRRVTFEFKDATLAQVTAYFEAKTHENFVLDPVGRLAGSINPSTTVSGSAKDVPLREALVGLLKPFGLVPVIKSEVVVLAKPSTP
jgi:thiol-disulfide isomerase/thioredoxin